MRILLLIGLVVMPFAAANSQGRAIEASVGVAVATYTRYKSSSFGETDLAIGSQQLHLGLFVSRRVAIEPGIGFAYTTAAGSSASDLEVSVALPYYFSPAWGHSGIFAGPHIGIDRTTATGDYQVEWQWNYGLVAGDKIEVAKPISIKLMAEVIHAPARRFVYVTWDAYTAVLGLVGVSVFFK